MHRSLVLLAAACVAVAASTTVAQEKPAEVQVKAVSHEEMTKTIKSLQGKVVVVDCWALT